ncbi:MAG TPA: 50S ribosomal protein L22 [Candidatus Paceibacterota bacterium]|nr:50S ribosomal protein L22 [Candidatus Paceibacterota bacterium]
MKAVLSNFKQSPRKVRLVADMIRGKNVSAAKDALLFLPKKSAPEMIKLLNSAIANARQKGMNPDELVVKSVSVDKGTVLRRYTPKARGRGAAIRRAMSHVVLELGEGAQKTKPARAAKTAKAKTQ